MINLTKEAKLTRVMNAVAAGTSTQSSSVIDQKDFDGCTFIVAFGAITQSSAVEVKIQQGAESDGSDMADVSGASVSFTGASSGNDDNVVVAVEIMRPVSRYVRCQIVRATQNAVIDSVVALQTDPKTAPVTHDATTVKGTDIVLSAADE